jgi:hypothetical protein
VIPNELKDVPRWHNWEDKNGTKIPLAVGGGNAKSNDSTTWTTYANAESSGRPLAFELGDGFAGVDLDNCLDSRGVLREWAIPIVSYLDGVAYAEVSPSGQGIKFTTRATKPKEARCVHVVDASDKQQIEVYDHSRFWTITGNSYAGQNTIGDGQAAINKICERYLMGKKEPDPDPVSSPVVVTPYVPHEGTTLESNAQAYCDAVVPVYQGSRNTTVFKLAGGLSQIEYDDQKLTKEQVHEYVQRWNQNLVEPLSEDEVKKTTDSAMRNGTPPRKKPRYSNHARVRNVDLSSIPGTKAVDTAIPRDVVENAPGVLGDLIKWMQATCLYDMPELFLSSSLALMSLVVGRKIMDPLGARPNLFLLSMGLTGSGKEHGRSCIKKCLTACGADDWIAPENIGSSAGLSNRLNDFPASLFQIDEFGQFLSTVADPKSASYLKEIEADLLRLYTSADTKWVGKAYADSEKTPTIDQPYCVVSGSCTPDSLWGALSTSQVHSGLLGRMQIFEVPGYVQLVEELPYGLRGQDPPQDIINEISWWLNYHSGGQGDLAVLKPNPRAMEWSDLAHRRLEDHMRETANKRISEDLTHAAVWSRSAEKANKLAMLSAASERRFEIDLKDADWAIALQNTLTRKLVSKIESSVSDNRVERDKKKVLGKITERMTLTDLKGKTQFLKNAAERWSVLEELHGCGKIIITEETVGNIKTRWIAPAK